MPEFDYDAALAGVGSGKVWVVLLEIAMTGAWQPERLRALGQALDGRPGSAAGGKISLKGYATFDGGMLKFKVSIISYAAIDADAAEDWALRFWQVMLRDKVPAGRVAHLGEPCAVEVRKVDEDA